MTRCAHACPFVRPLHSPNFVRSAYIAEVQLLGSYVLCFRGIQLLLLMHSTVHRRLWRCPVRTRWVAPTRSAQAWVSSLYESLNPLVFFTRVLVLLGCWLVAAQMVCDGANSLMPVACY
jgi:hypothetical protein